MLVSQYFRISSNLIEYSVSTPIASHYRRLQKTIFRYSHRGFHFHLDSWNRKKTMEFARITNSLSRQ